MKYLVYLMSFLFLLAFAGCEKAKDTDMDVNEATTKAMEASTEVMEESTEAMEEVTDEAKEMMEEVTE
ncbi:hypothetical protein ACFL3L_01065 [Candidatus Neomarinimicrobiota bacterium]